MGRLAMSIGKHSASNHTKSVAAFYAIFKAWVIISANVILGDLPNKHLI